MVDQPVMISHCETNLLQSVWNRQDLTSTTEISCDWMQGHVTVRVTDRKLPPALLEHVMRRVRDTSL